MKHFIKVWWHCLWNMFEGHRMCQITWSDDSKEWACSLCDKRLIDLLKAKQNESKSQKN